MALIGLLLVIVGVVIAFVAMIGLVLALTGSGGMGLAFFFVSVSVALIVCGRKLQKDHPIDHSAEDDHMDEVMAIHKAATDRRKAEKSTTKMATIRVAAEKQGASDPFEVEQQNAERATKRKHAFTQIRNTLTALFGSASIPVKEYPTIKGRPDGTTTKSFKVAGVTFNNPDGTSRQEILRRVYEEEPPFDEISVMLDQYYWKRRPAMAVKVNDIWVGSIREEDLPRLAKALPMLKGVKDFKVEPFYNDDGELIYAAKLVLTFKK